MKTRHRQNLAFQLTLLAATALPGSLAAQTATFSEVVNQNTFVNSGAPTTSYGTMGAMEIAVPTTSQNRTEESLIQFNTASLESQFNAALGAGNWAVTSITVTLYSNFATQGTQPNNTTFNAIAAGGFELDWLSDNSWSSTGGSAINWNTLPTVLPGTGGNTLISLGDFNWLANGAGTNTWALTPNASINSEIQSGGLVTIFGQPTADSTVGYLFNTLTQGNPPVLNVTASAVPEPNTFALILAGLAGISAICRGKKKG